MDAPASRDNDLPVPDSVAPMYQTKPSYSEKRMRALPKLSMHSASMVNIYGVEVPGTEGRAGMAARSSRFPCATR